MTSEVKQEITIGEIETEFYEKFFFQKDFEPYPVQEEAFDKIFAEKNVMVMVPTGTGKTVIAKAAIYKAFRQGQSVVYTTPLRALTEEKYRELCEDFGEENVGFATGDYKINPRAPIQVVVAEILWNKVFSARQVQPAHVVVMDEGHYFNDRQRGYVWEQTIMSLHPATQLIILSATVGNPVQFCQWCYIVRRVPMELVQSSERKIPLEHLYEEKYLVEMVKELFERDDYPAIVFGFNRSECFERARILKSCRKFITPEEQVRMDEIIGDRIHPEGLGEKFRSLLHHGIGIHHAGILPIYKQIVEELALERLVKFIVSTETISAGINLPAKVVIFPSIVKGGRNTRRFLIPAEYHQMAGRAGRPQFDNIGIAITLAPEDVVKEFRKDIAKMNPGSKYSDSETEIKRRAYSRAKSSASQRGELVWDEAIFQKLIEGESAPLQSHTQLTTEQVLAIGLPDLRRGTLPGFSLLEEEMKKEKEAKEKKQKKIEKKTSQPTLGGNSQLLGLLEKLKAQESESQEDEIQETEEPAENSPTEENQAQIQFHHSAEISAEERKLPVYLRLNILNVIDNLLIGEAEKVVYHKTLAKISRNLRALNVLDVNGKQVKGKLIRDVRGGDGLFIYFCLMKQEFSYIENVELAEFLVDNDIIQKRLNWKSDDKKREWIRNRLRERRRDEVDVVWDDVEQEYNDKFPREPSFIEKMHKEFTSQLPHPDLHQGKVFKEVWQMLETRQMTFMDFVREFGLEEEEGSLFSYLTRLLNTAKMLYDVTNIQDFQSLEVNIRSKLGAIDIRLLDDILWGQQPFNGYRSDELKEMIQEVKKEQETHDSDE